jgi:hypothetical protein
MGNVQGLDSGQKVLRKQTVWVARKNEDRFMKQAVSSEVAAVLARYPTQVRAKLMNLRRIILDTASAVSIIQKIEETLKWGEPSYVVVPARLGSTVRIDWKAARESEYAMYFKCTADIVPAFRERFSDVFDFGGNRSIVFGMDDRVPEPELKQCIALALTYHRNKKMDPVSRWEWVSARIE